MIIFRYIPKKEPYQKLYEYYQQANLKKQSSIDAMVVSSIMKNELSIDSRYVNLKMVDRGKFIFFSNYKSKKSIQFKSHNEVSLLIYWNKINVQIRIKGKIKKTSKNFNQEYFSKRDTSKNALAISSHQSQSIHSFKEVKSQYEFSLKNDDLKKCPNYWGGYFIEPFYFEFWEGHKNRLNKRVEYFLEDAKWRKAFLQP
tara:strand:+ start:291 stop:887 length:597 start_codon:yes stop_codon:yes gene_type:complete